MREVQPCGTVAAFKRHYKAGEKPCEPCLAAHRRYRYLRAHGGRAVIKTRETIVDVLVTHDRWMSTDVLIDWVTTLHPEWERSSVRRMIWRLRADGLIECREIEHTYTDTYSKATYRPGRVRTYKIAEWRADESAWEALEVVA